MEVATGETGHLVEVAAGETGHLVEVAAGETGSGSRRVSLRSGGPGITWNISTCFVKTYSIRLQLCTDSVSV